MVKNIILDIGGILFDDSKENIDKVLKEDSSCIYKKAFGTTFKDCLLGKITVSEHIETFKNTKEYNKIKYILDKENLKISYPLMEKNFEFVCDLKKKGYHLFLLSNITEDSYHYIKNVIDLDQIFDGGIYSYQEKVIKPDPAIYRLIIKKYCLNKEETIFFDDNEKNVMAARQCGISSFVFHNVRDIVKHL